MKKFKVTLAIKSHDMTQREYTKVLDADDPDWAVFLAKVCSGMMSYEWPVGHVVTEVYGR